MYDGFGNLNNVTVTKGTAPSLNVTYNASTNRRTTDTADANGNITPAGLTTTFDVSNRIATTTISGGTARYSYAPDNKRIWRGLWTGSTQTTDELTYYSGGAKLKSYNLTVSGSNLRAASTGYYEFFGGKMIKNAGGYINQDRLGSIGKFFPYGQERPSATSNGKEKFATYFRDSETGLDYADNRYHSSGDGRFLTPDPYVNSAGIGSPGSWNRYAYVEGDPVNGHDPQGLSTVFPGVPAGTFNNFTINNIGQVVDPSRISITVTATVTTAPAFGAGLPTNTQRTDLRPDYCFNEAYYANPLAMPPECMDPNWQPPPPPPTVTSACPEGQSMTFDVFGHPTGCAGPQVRNFDFYRDVSFARYMGCMGIALADQIISSDDRAALFLLVHIAVYGSLAVPAIGVPINIGIQAARVVFGGTALLYDTGLVFEAWSRCTDPATYGAVESSNTAGRRR